MNILNFIRGFCMAIADSIPGVSGGTIAFILGFYDEFVESLNNVIYGAKLEKLEGFKFLFKIGFGWIVGFLLSILFITSIFEKNIYEISSLFLGFIVASIPSIVISEKGTLLSRKKDIIFLVMGIVIVYYLTYYNFTCFRNSGISLENDLLNFNLAIYIFCSGMIAISAMVLPGISGSSILLIFGLYAPILIAVEQVLRFNLEYSLSIAIFISGILVGILFTVRIIRYLFKKYRPSIMFLIIGLMIGSIYSVIMGPVSLSIAKSPMSINTFSLSFFIVGSLFIPILEKIKKYFK